MIPDRALKHTCSYPHTRTPPRGGRHGQFFLFTLPSSCRRIVIVNRTIRSTQMDWCANSGWGGGRGARRPHFTVGPGPTRGDTHTHARARARAHTPRAHTPATSSRPTHLAPLTGRSPDWSPLSLLLALRPIFLPAYRPPFATFPSLRQRNPLAQCQRSVSWIYVSTPDRDLSPALALFFCSRSVPSHTHSRSIIDGRWVCVHWYDRGFARLTRSR